ncbi:MAG: NAD(P)H-dependent oxidoreductase [Anaerolineae bacterium]|nr:NAD(P)H-dependent oxidoreductase [Anaerolineae bacterium]
MAHVIVTYFSVTGHTEALAEAVVDGVKSVNGVTCELKPVAEMSNEHWLEADGIIVGSPTYFGQMAAEAKALFDETAKIYGKLEGKVGAAFTTSGGAGCGHELTNMSIITAMLVSGMVVQGTTKGPHFGPFAVGKPGEEGLAKARDLGIRVADLTLRLAG